jgi:hypothetical protein
LGRLRLVPLSLLEDGEEHWRATFHWGPRGERHHRSFHVVGKMSWQFESIQVTSEAKVIPAVIETGPIDDRRMVGGDNLAGFVGETIRQLSVVSWFSQVDDTVEVMFREMTTIEGDIARIDGKRIGDQIPSTWEMTLSWWELGQLHKVEFLSTGPLVIAEEVMTN